MMLSDAPFFEDVFLQRCLGALTGFMYAELDLADLLDSISQWFDLSGWRGIIVTPPDRVGAWRGARPNAEIIEAVRNDLWDQAKPFGFIRFAAARADTASIIAAAQPLIVLNVNDHGIAGYQHVQVAGMTGSAPDYFIRMDRLAEFAPLLAKPLARDEFRMAERQAAALGRMLIVADAANAGLRAELDHARQEIAARDHDLRTRDQDVQSRDRDIQSRDRDIEALNRALQARDQAIMARDRDIAASHHTIALRDRELAVLRPRAEALARLAAMLDWPEAPRALRTVLPLARALRRFRPR